MQYPFVNLLMMYLLILCFVPGIVMFIFGRIFRKKKLWLAGVSLFGIAVLTIAIFVIIDLLSR
jgi:hypothetical protein